MPTVETSENVSRVEIGEVIVERVAQGMKLYVKCPPWSEIIKQRNLLSDDYNICGDLTGRPMHYKPDGIDGRAGIFRESYSILYDNKVNLAPLLASGLENGQTFVFPGVFTSESMKKVAQGFKDFLTNAYNDFSRPVKIEYRLTSGD